MLARLKDLTDIVHDSGESIGYFRSRKESYIPGDTYHMYPDGRVVHTHTTARGDIRQTTLSRHYADFNAALTDCLHPNFGCDVTVRVHMKSLYNYGRKNATRERKDMFDLNMEELVQERPLIPVVDRGELFEPEYAYLRRILGLPLDI